MRYVKKFGYLINEENFVLKEFKEDFFKLFPKKDTKITFVDRDSTYTLELYDISINGRISELIFIAENNSKICIKNPFYISEKDSNKISLLETKISTQSKELVDKMFDKIDIILF